MKKIVLVVLFAGILLTLGALEASAGWYDCKVAKLIGRSEGDIAIQVDPGVNETGFTERSRIQIKQSAGGSNKNLAIILTAISMDYEITVSVENPPTFAENQIPTSIGILLPEIEE